MYCRLWQFDNWYIIACGNLMNGAVIDICFSIKYLWLQLLYYTFALQDLCFTELFCAIRLLYKGHCTFNKLFKL